MDLYYCKTPDGNFGDDMNLWFWDRLIPEWREIAPDRTLCGIGTLINRKAFSAMDRILVCGSGTGYGPVQRFDPAKVEFAWVRGPRTARILDVDPSLAITDPAVMVSDFPDFADGPRAEGDVIFVPHRLTANLDLDWKRLSRRSGVRTVSPKDDAKEVIRELRDARLVIAESMHAAIIADAFRTPWVPLVVSHHFNTFKWGDWADSLDLDLRLNTALRLPRAAYFALRNARGALKRPKRRTRTDGEITQTFVNPNTMGRQERDRLKGLIAHFQRPVEAMLARDIARAARCEPSLSDTRILDDRKSRILEKAREIRRMAGVEA